MYRDRQLFNKDLNYGLKKEYELIDLLQTVFPNVEKTKEIYCKHDFESDDVVLELKSRRVRKDTYVDTMIGSDKIIHLLNHKKDGYAVFNFTDGLYYFKITDASLQDCRFCIGGRYDRGCDESNDYCFIPTNMLSEVKIEIEKDISIESKKDC